MKILIVDDDAAQRDAAKEALTGLHDIKILATLYEVEDELISSYGTEYSNPNGYEAVLTDLCMVSENPTVDMYGCKIPEPTDLSARLPYYPYGVVVANIALNCGIKHVGIVSTGSDTGGHDSYVVSLATRHMYLFENRLKLMVGGKCPMLDEVNQIKDWKTALERVL